MAKAQSEVPLRSQITMILLYTYQSVPDAELSKYLAFLQSDAGRSFTKTTNVALVKAMANAAERVGMQIRKIVPATP